MKYISKINLTSPVSWEHHRHGWKRVVDSFNILNNPNGTHFYSYLEQIANRDETINEEWIGFFHNVPFHPIEMKGKYYMEIDAVRFIESRTWKESKKYCRGLFVLSNYLGEFFKTRVDVPVNVLYHPTGISTCLFDPYKFINNKQRMIVTVGHWMRRFESIEKLNVKKYKKALQQCGVGSYLYDRVNVLKLERKSDVEFDLMLSENLIFLDFYDASANNTIVECIGSNTPVLVNKIPAVVEYLGENYPLFYTDLNQASNMADDLNLVLSAHNYLKLMDKSKFQLDYFIDSFVDSNIYKSLPVNRNKISFL